MGVAFEVLDQSQARPRCDRCSRGTGRRGPRHRGFAGGRSRGTDSSRAGRDPAARSLRSAVTKASPIARRPDRQNMIERGGAAEAAMRSCASRASACPDACPAGIRKGSVGNGGAEFHRPAKVFATSSCHTTETPPSRNRHCPLMKEARSLQRKSIAFADSSRGARAGRAAPGGDKGPSACRCSRRKRATPASDRSAA